MKSLLLVIGNIIILLLLSCKQDSSKLTSRENTLIKDTIISPNGTSEKKHWGIDTLLIDKYDTLIYNNPGDSFDYETDQNILANFLGDYGGYLRINNNIFRLRFELGSNKDSFIVEKKINRSWLFNMKIDFVGKWFHLSDENLDGNRDLVMDKKIESLVYLFDPNGGILDSSVFTMDFGRTIVDSLSKIFSTRTYSQDANYKSTLYQFKQYKNGKYYIDNYYSLFFIRYDDEQPDKVKQIELYKVLQQPSTSSSRYTYRNDKSATRIKKIKVFDYTKDFEDTSDIRAIPFWYKNYKQLLKEY